MYVCVIGVSMCVCVWCVCLCLVCVSGVFMCAVCMFVLCECGWSVCVCVCVYRGGAGWGVRVVDCWASRLCDQEASQFFLQERVEFGFGVTDVS